jgi:hypothetical protein
MNERITSLYVAISKNEVVCFETNLKMFVAIVNKEIPGTRNYDWFYRAFKDVSKFKIALNDQDYYFQRLI